MSILLTSRGSIRYKNKVLYLGDKVINPMKMYKGLVILTASLDKTGMSWGPAFGTLIGIVRNGDFLPWIPNFDLYILKEDEERFKDALWNLLGAGFNLARHERRGLYYLEYEGEFYKVFVLHKISAEIRHTGGSDFIHEKYIQNTVKWDFKDISLNVPQDLDEYLTFQYDEWIVPKQTKKYRLNFLEKIIFKTNQFIQDNLPDKFYYYWTYKRRVKDFKRFKQLCKSKGTPLSSNIELSYIRPRKHKRVLTVGVYDLIHKGHVELYRRAKGLGDYLIVAVQDGNYILKYKPEAKILNSTEDRMYMVKSIRYVDETIVYKDVDEIVKNVDFDVFVTGPDQIHSGFQNAIKWCEENGKEHIVLARTDGVSSSQLKEKIANKKKINN